MKTKPLALLIIVFVLITTHVFAQNSIWINALDKTSDSKEVQLIYQKFGKPDILENNSTNMLRQMSGKINPWYKKGLQLQFSNDEYGMMKTITFYNSDEEYNKYNLELPFGLSFTDTPANLKSKYINVIKNEDYEDFYEVLLISNTYPNIYIHYKYKQGKVAYIKLYREDFKSFSPFKIYPHGTDCEKISTILKDVKYNFTHIRKEKETSKTFPRQWSSLLSPSFSKKTTLESDLIRFEIYKGPDLEFAAKTISTVDQKFITCVKRSGYKINMLPRDSETSVTYLSEDEDFEITTSIERDIETINGVESTIYTCTIEVINYKEYDDCELIEYLYENSISDFRYLKKDLLEKGMIDIWDTNISTFNRSTIRIRNKSLKMTMYDGTNLKEANSTLAEIYNTWEECNKDSDQAFIFLEDKNTLGEAFGSRIIKYASYDDIYITFKIFTTINTDENKPNDEYNYTSSVSFYHKDK